jgi:autophagy-related protein 13
MVPLVFCCNNFWEENGFSEFSSKNLGPKRVNFLLTPENCSLLCILQCTCFHFQKTPFAGTDGASDLGKFYRECQGAPGLAMFDEEPTVAETLESITDQLAVFEANMKDFDDFVDALQTNE